MHAIPEARLICVALLDTFADAPNSIELFTNNNAMFAEIVKNVNVMNSWMFEIYGSFF